MNRVARESATERLIEQSATVAEDVRQLGRLTSAAAMEKVGQAREMAGKAYEDSVQTLNQGMSYLESRVKERPLRSVAIAVGAGALLGFLLAKKR